MHFVTVVIVLAVMDYLYFKLRYFSKNGPPVWCGLPFVGIVPVLMLPSQLYVPIYKWYLRTAPDVVITRHFYPLVVVKNSYVAEVQKNEACVHRTSYPPFEVLGELTTGKRGWSLFDGGWLNSDWRAGRKVNMMALHVLPKKRKFERISEVATMFLRRIEQQDGKLWDYEDDLTFSKFQESANLNLGATFDNDNILDFAHSLKGVLTVAFGLFLISVVIPLKLVFAFENLLPHSKRPSVFGRVYERLLWRLQTQKVAVSGSEPRDYVEALLRFRSPALAHEHLRENAMFLVIASTLTTLHSTTAVLSYLATIPEYQKKVFHEFNEVVGCEPLNADHLDKMHFLRAVTYEALRISPPIPLVERYTRNATRIGEFNIPANISFALLIQSELMDSKVYSDPETFNPYRFLDGDLKLKEPVVGPFSRGRRNCPGQDIAIMSTLLYIAKIIQHFEILPERKDVEIPEYDGGLFPNLPKVPLHFLRRRGAPEIERLSLKGGLTDILLQAIEDDEKAGRTATETPCIKHCDA